MNLYLRLRPIERQLEEIQMGHCIWGYTVPGIDCVSATANTDGFTPLTSLMRKYPWDDALIGEACKDCNRDGVPLIVANLRPRLILLPQSNDNSNPRVASAYVKCLLEEGVRNLHFSHYGFVQTQIALSEIEEILYAIESANEKDGEIMLYVDIDSRYAKEMNEFLEQRTRYLKPSQ